MKDYKTKTKEDFKDSLVFQRDLAEMLGQEVKVLQAHVLALGARVEALETENEALVEGSCLAEFNGYKLIKEENARLRKVVDDLAWFRDRAIERTVPGIADTTDAVYRLIQDLRKVVDAARERVLDLITKVPFLDVVQGTDELQQLACDLDMERKTCNHHSIYADYKGRCGDCGELKK